jgi:hypothetical protein
VVIAIEFVSWLVQQFSATKITAMASCGPSWLLLLSKTEITATSTVLCTFFSFSFLPLCSCECSPVARYHTCQNFFYHGTSHPKLHRLPCSLLSQPLASTPLAEITLLRIFTAHTLPCINSRSQQQAFFRILEPWGWNW